MGKIVKTSDFVGKYAITQNNLTTSSLQAFIDKYEIEYLYDLFGVDFATLFYADISSGTFLPPVNADYAALFNPIHTNEVRSDGIKVMLLGFIYWEFTRMQPVKNTITGNVNAQNEVSIQVDFVNTNIYLMYNDAIKTYSNIDHYVRLNPSVYGAFGICHKWKCFNHWSI